MMDQSPHAANSVHSTKVMGRAVVSVSRVYFLHFLHGGNHCTGQTDADTMGTLNLKSERSGDPGLPLRWVWVARLSDYQWPEQRWAHHSQHVRRGMSHAISTAMSHEPALSPILQASANPRLAELPIRGNNE